MAKQLVNTKTNKVIFKGTKQQVLNYVASNYSDSPWIKTSIQNGYFTVRSFAMAVCAMWQIDLDVI